MAKINNQLTLADLNMNGGSDSGSGSGSGGETQPVVVNDFEGLAAFMGDVYSDNPTTDITTVDRTFYFKDADLNTLYNIFKGLSLSVWENVCNLAKSHIHMDMIIHGALYNEGGESADDPTPKILAISHLDILIEVDPELEAGYQPIMNVNGTELHLDYAYSIISGSIRFKYLPLQ